jgi:hypothetical protein
MSSRRKVMLAAGVFECPGFCAQGDDEVQLRQHIGLWTEILDRGGPDGLTTAQARPVLEWWDWSSGYQPGCEVSYVELDISATPDGTPWLLTPADVASVISGLAYVRDLAAEPTDWKPAYHGAERDRRDDEIEATG